MFGRYFYKGSVSDLMTKVFVEQCRVQRICKNILIPWDNLGSEINEIGRVRIFLKTLLKLIFTSLSSGTIEAI